MIRTIRSLSVLAFAATTAIAQNPPVPPVTPARPAPPVPAPTPRVLRLDDLEKLRIDGTLKLDSKLRLLDGDMRLLSAQDARNLTEASREASRAAMEMSRETTRNALEASRAAMEDLRLRGVYAPEAPIRFNDGPRYQNDPADSLYNRALALLNNSDYRAAAQRFKEVQTKYPQTQYMARAMYYQAFALNRAGNDAELREAASVLEALQQKYPNTRVGAGVGGGDQWGGGVTDASGLLIRVRRNLAERGDASARAQLNQAAAAGTLPCDREDQALRSQALSALMQIDPASAMPKVQEVLTKRDECSTELRRNALQIITQRGDEKSVPTLLTVAKQDPSASVRRAALEFVSRFPNDEVFATLESMARSESNDGVRRTAAQMLVGNQSPRARQAVRSIIENDTIPDGVRTEMLSRFNENRGTADDATWLRASYANVKSSAVRRSIVGAVGRLGGADSQKWLTDLAGKDDETSSIRADAFRYVSQSMTVADLSRAYDAAGSRAMRSSIVRTLNQRKETEAVDKLIDIARKSTDLEIKRQVIDLLTERKDPKITALLIELISR